MDASVKHGLLGKSLSHSHSPMIHRALGAPDFSLVETDDPSLILTQKAFESLMVTIPYKEAVIPFLSEQDDLSRRIGAVNLIVHTDGRLKGYNTDYHGLRHMIEASRISISGLSCVVIGHGGAAKCAQAVLEDLGATRIAFLVRQPKYPGDVTFENIESLEDAEVVLNASPIGMHPHENEPVPFSLKTFKRLAVFYDLVYNPLQTPWRREAKALKIPSFCGLSMLVYQAVKAREIVDKTTISESKAAGVLEAMHRHLSNIVLIGLPLSGKSKLADLLAKFYNRPMLDSDADIEAATGKTIETIFREDGEAAFRQMELAWAIKHQDVRGAVISTGGGMIENPTIVALLAKNGFLVFLDKDPKTVHHVSSTGRPLLVDEDAFRKLHAKRIPLYLQAADLTIPAETPKESVLRLIEVNLHEAARR